MRKARSMKVRMLHAPCVAMCPLRQVVMSAHIARICTFPKIRLGYT